MFDLSYAGPFKDNTGRYLIFGYCRGNLGIQTEISPKHTVDSTILLHFKQPSVGQYAQLDVVSNTRLRNESLQQSLVHSCKYTALQIR